MKQLHQRISLVGKLGYSRNLGLALAALERHEEAVAAFKQAETLAPGDVRWQISLGWGQALAGQRHEALAILEALEHRRSHEYVSGFGLAMVTLALGDHDQALSWLQQAADERTVMMIYLDTWPAFDPLRSDPRFQTLLRRMHFPETAETSPTT